MLADALLGVMTMSDNINTPSKTQTDFLKWYADEKRDGLKDIKFYPGDVSQATMDDVLKEALEGLKAVKEGRCTDLSTI